MLSPPTYITAASAGPYVPPDPVVTRVVTDWNGTSWTQTESQERDSRLERTPVDSSGKQTWAHNPLGAGSKSCPAHYGAPSADRLLPQPGGFEGSRFPIEAFQAGDQPLAEGVEVDDALLELDSIAPASPLSNDGYDLITSVDELGCSCQSSSKLSKKVTQNALSSSWPRKTRLPTAGIVQRPKLGPRAAGLHRSLAGSTPRDIGAHPRRSPATSPTSKAQRLRGPWTDSGNPLAGPPSRV